MEETTPAPPRRAATLFVVVTVVLDMMAIGIVIPVWPKLIQSVGGGGMDRTALIYGVFASIFAAMQFLAAPIQGAMSDRFGRRPVILASNFGVGANYLVLALAPNLAWLLVARMLSGAFAASISTSYAYLADVNPPEKRAAAYGLLGGALGLGIAIGPAVGGLAGNFSAQAPFFVAAALSLTNGLYGLFVLPESLAKTHRTPIDWKRLDPIGALAGLVRDYPSLRWLGAGAILLTLSGQTINTVAVLYTTYRYHWTPGDVGLLMTLMGFSGMAVQTGLVRLAIARLGEWTTMIGGLSLQALATACLALAPTGPAYWVACVALSLGGVGGPAWQALMSRQVGPNAQGRLAGASVGISSLTGMIAPFLFTGLFALAVRQKSPWLPLGTPFLLAGCMGAAAVIIAIRTRRKGLHA